MKLIHRTTLHYREGTSDKVYEVDLCEVGAGRYVVNFRYGRRGSNLKEGTKTTQPASETEARKVFDKLVASKVNSGYRDVTNREAEEQGSRGAEENVETQYITSDPRQRAILNCLAKRGTQKWPLERAIWRAGELKIAEATPLLISLLGTGDPFRDYCIAWALGWCGGEEAISALNRLYQNSSTPEFIKRIAWEALLKLADAETARGLRSQVLELLPPHLRQLAQNGPAPALASALKNQLEGSDYQIFVVLDRIYQIDNEYVRPALIETIKTAPLRPNYFQRIRHIYKIAEYRQDAEVFGILAYRFEKEEAMYRSNSYQIYVPGVLNIRRYEYKHNPETRRWERFDNPEFEREMQRPDARVAYSTSTRDYFRRRLWRTLKQLGEEGEPTSYVNMAAGVLKQYSDADAESARQTTFYRYTPNWQRISSTRDWDAYAAYMTFNHILYENSPRYVLMENSQAWRCQEGYKPGSPEPSVREEAFPQLWEQKPEVLLQLLLESKCLPVHNFAVKALKACLSFCTTIDVSTIIELVNQPYEVTADFGFELALQKYDRAAPNLELILALANCRSERARHQAFRWIEEQRERIVGDSNAIASLVTSQHADTRQFARRLLGSSILSDPTAKVLIGRIIGILLTLEPNQTELAKEIGETLLVSFTPQLRSIGFSVILDLLGHQLPEIQELGARILLNHEIPALELPNELIESLLNSPYENVRGIGVRIFGQLPDETLLRRYELLLAMSVHELPDMRSSIRPVIRRLGGEHPDFVTMIAAELIHILMLKERHEGVHSDILHLLKLDLVGWMSGVSRETAMRLLKAQSTAAQELGGLVLIANQEHWTQHFDTSEIVKLASHEILAVREAARQMFLQRLNTFRTDTAELLAAVRILEAKWDDSREFASRIFSTEFSPEDFPPEILVSICDSIKEDVRQFGRDLVTRNFQQSYGDEYLLKFSEHPATDMQLFVTNYLESYAVNNPERLQALTPYFVTVLSRVNKGGVAKRRVFAFLEQEALKSEAAAMVVAEILTRQSVTIAIGDKAKAIQIMLKIHRQYPQIYLPIQVQAVAEVRS
jgi:predicted DNA-binding WGR domain protein